MELFNGGEIAKKILSNLNKEQSSAVQFLLLMDQFL